MTPGLKAGAILFQFQIIHVSIKCRLLVIPAKAGIYMLIPDSGFPPSQE